MLSASPGRPQLQVGIGWSGASSPSIGSQICPSSPAIPAAPRMTCPDSITPPPSPVPTMTDTDDRWYAVSGPKCAWWAYSAAALASLLKTTGMPRRTSSARRTSKPRHSALAKLVAPFDEMTPSAVTGPGVSRPTARTAARGVPVNSSTSSSDRASASIALSGPSRTRLGDSAMSSTRKRPAASSTVALIVVPPLSSPATTH